LCSVQGLCRLSDDGDGDFGRTLGANRQAGGAVNAGELRIVHAVAAQAVQALGVGALAAQGADVEGVGRQGEASDARATRSAGSSSFGSWVRVTTAVRRSGRRAVNASSGQAVERTTSGNRSSVAQARRGSTTVTSYPASVAMGTSA